MSNSVGSSIVGYPVIYLSVIRLVTFVGFDLLFVLLMTLVLEVTLWHNGASFKLLQESVLYPIGFMAFLLLTRTILWLYHSFQGRRDGFPLKIVFLQTLRDWIPFILIDLIYENLHDLSRFFHTHDVAGTIMSLDKGIFGVELTLWSQRFFNPVLTDYMAFAYALYLVFPLVLMYFFSYRNHRSELQEIILALSLMFFLGFLGYVFFPCSPPRYFLENQYTRPPHLYGLFLYNQLQGKWDHLSTIRAGAFPSLHVGISTIALIFAFHYRNLCKFTRYLFRIYIPLIISLWISTVYLRHHWFIDIGAGWVLAFFSSWAARALIKAWEDLRRLGKSELPSSPETIGLPQQATGD